MPMFNKSQYVWLESFFRDELHKLKFEVEVEYVKGSKEQLERLISNLSEQLQQDSPKGFNPDQFHRDIFYPIDVEIVDNKRPKYNLEKLLAHHSPEKNHGEISWGQDVGREGDTTPDTI